MHARVFRAHLDVAQPSPPLWATAWHSFRHAARRPVDRSESGVGGAAPPIPAPDGSSASACGFAAAALATRANSHPRAYRAHRRSLWPTRRAASQRLQLLVSRRGIRVDHCSGEGSGLGAPRACCGGCGSPQVVPHAYCVVEGSLGSARRRGRRAARRAAQSLVVSVSCVGRSEAPHVETLRGACRSPPTTRTGQTHTVVR